MSVKVSVYNKQRKISITPDIKKLIKDTCRATLKSENFTENCEIEVSIVDDAQIRVINSECRNVDASTDVLSFPLGEGGKYDTNPESGALMLGDVVISAEHAVMQADLFGHGKEREIAYLTVHSVLHLLRYDHVGSETERKNMRLHEEKVMEIMGLMVER